MLWDMKVSGQWGKVPGKSAREKSLRRSFRKETVGGNVQREKCPLPDRHPFVLCTFILRLSVSCRSWPMFKIKSTRIYRAPPPAGSACVLHVMYRTQACHQVCNY